MARRRRWRRSRERADYGWPSRADPWNEVKRRIADVIAWTLVIAFVIWCVWLAVR
jgi:hypothetical protein